MAKPFLISFLIAAFFPIGGFAATFEIPAFSGKLRNHGSLPSSLFTVTYHFRCEYLEGGSSFPISCGHVEKGEKVSASGDFEVESVSIELDPESEGKDRRLNISAWIQIEREVAGFPFGFLPGDLIHNAEVLMPGPRKPSKKVTHFTLFETEQQDLLAKVEGAVDEAWFQSIGRDLSVFAELDFSNGLEGEGGFFSHNPYMKHISREGHHFFDWRKMPARIFLVSGDLAADTPVKFRSWDNLDGQERVFSFPFSPKLPESVRSVHFSGSAYSDPLALRTLSGKWLDGFLNLSHPFEEKLKLVEDQSYFTADIRCLEGKLSGELIFRDGQVPNEEYSPETGRIQASGSCDGERGELRFSLETKEGKLIPVSARIDRISAVKAESRERATFLSTDMGGSLGNPSGGEELGMFITLRGPEGEAVGDISISLRD